MFAVREKPWRPEGVRDDQLLAIFSGTHGPANGLDAVLNAAAVLKERGWDEIQIALIGQGRQKSKLQARANAENLTNVHFLDPVPKAALTGLMAGADMGLQILQNVPAFYFGTSPNKFFDYLAAGLPVLNNYPGWLTELIVEHDCGYAVQPDDPIAFAEALIAAAENPKILRRKGIQARGLAESDFSRESLSIKWVDWVTGSRQP